MITSYDLYNIVSSFAILMVSIFLCIALYYAIIILKKWNRSIDEVTERIKGVSDMTKEFFSKTASLSAYVQTALSTFQMFLGRYEQRKEKKRKGT